MTKDKIVDDMKIAKVTLREFIEIVRRTNQDDLTPFGWGMPGIGKTEGIRELARLMKWFLLRFDAHLKDICDLKGVLFPVQNKKGETIARYLPPDELPQIERDGETGIIVFDEITFAVPTMQNALHSFIQDNTIGQYILPPKYIKVALSNRECDQAHIFSLSAPTRNRFRHFQIVPDYEVWLMDYAIKYGIHPLVTSFLKLKPDYLAQLPDGQLTYCTPRIWTQVSKELHKTYPTMTRRDLTTGNITSINLQHEAIKACVGEGIANEFFAHQLVGDKALKYCEMIMKGQMPKNIEGDASVHWVINMYLAYQYKKDPKTVSPLVCKYVLDTEGHEEMAVLLLHLCYNTEKHITTIPEWRPVVKKYMSSLYDTVTSENK